MSGRHSTTPLVSVIMATFDEPSLILCRALDSILNQTLDDLELIVCSDNPDNAAMHRTVARRYARDGRVRFVFNLRNIGLGFALNRCIGLARGTFIARMDADDVSLPERLAHQVAALQSSGPGTVSFTGAMMVDGRGKQFPRAAPSNADFARHFFPHDPFLHGTLMMPADDFRRFGYRISEPPEDYELYFRLHRAGFRFTRVDGVLYRSHFRAKSAYRSPEALRQRAHRAARRQLALMNANAGLLSGCTGFAVAYARCLAVLATSATPLGYRSGKAVYGRLRSEFGR